MAAPTIYGKEIVIRYTPNGTKITWFIQDIKNPTMPVSAAANEQTVVATMLTAIGNVLTTPPV